MYLITEIAKLSEINVETIRYYERRELIGKPIKVNNKKLYSEDDLKRIEAIKKLQFVGFSLVEIKMFLDDKENNCLKLKELIEQKLKILNKYNEYF